MAVLQGRLGGPAPSVRCQTPGGSGSASAPGGATGVMLLPYLLPSSCSFPLQRILQATMAIAHAAACCAAHAALSDEVAALWWALGTGRTCSRWCLICFMHMLNQLRMHRLFQASPLVQKAQP